MFRHPLPSGCEMMRTMRLNGWMTVGLEGRAFALLTTGEEGGGGAGSGWFPGHQFHPAFISQFL